MSSYLDDGRFAGDGLSNGRFLFLSKRKSIGRTGEYGFGIDSRALSGVEGRDHYPGIFSIEENNTKTLIATDLLERIETYDMSLVQTFQAQFSQSIGNFEKFLNFLIELLNSFELIVEH